MEAFQELLLRIVTVSLLFGAKCSELLILKVRIFF